MRFTEYKPNKDELIRALVNGQADLIDITTGTAGEDQKIKHGLGRIPRGWWVVKGDVGSNGGGGGTVTDSSRAYLVYRTVLDNFQFVAPRGGSITAISYAYTLSDPGDTGSNMVLSVEKNGSSVYSTGTITLTSAGSFTGNQSQATGTDTFVAGDMIEMGISMTLLPDSAYMTAFTMAIELTFSETVSVTGGTEGVDLTPSTAWTSEYIYLRFPNAGKSLTIAVW